MKTKTLNQLWAQIERIRAYFDNPLVPGQAERLNRACEICNRYSRKAWQYIMTLPEWSFTASGFEDMPVPMKYYTEK